MNFGNGGIRTLINHVPFNMHLSFATHPKAWTYYTAFFPHLRTPEDAHFINENCPAEASNLTNPSKLFQDLTGFKRGSNHTAREYFYFDHLPPAPDIQAKRWRVTTHVRTRMQSKRRLHLLPSPLPTNHTSNHTASTNNHPQHTLHPNHSTNHNKHFNQHTTTPTHGDHPNIEHTQHTTNPYHSTPPSPTQHLTIYHTHTG